ncbi:hypothetical protein ACFL5V_05200 [Fibrobacterota bacterium]
MKTKILNSTALFLASSLCLAATPQTETQISFFRGSQLYSGGHLESWAVNDVRVTQIALPVMYSMDLKGLLPGLALDAVTTPVTGFLSGDATGVPDNTAAFGLSGTKSRISYNFKDRLVTTLGVQTPTGPSELALGQSALEGAFSTRQMHFRIAGLGSGWNIHYTLSSAVEIADDLIIGGSIGILTTGLYHPTEPDSMYNINTGLFELTTDDWNSGNEFSAAAGVDYIVYAGGRKMKMLGDLVYTYFTTDVWNGSDVFQAGPKWALNATAGTKISQGMYSTINLNVIFRQKNTIVDGGFDAMTGETVDVKRKAGTDVLLSHYLQFIRNKSKKPYVIARIYKFGARESAFTNRRFGNTLTGGLGAGGRMLLSARISLNGKAIVDIGGMDGNLLYGAELNGGINVRF